MVDFTFCGFIDEAATDLAGQVHALQANHMEWVDVRQVDGVNVADFSPEKAREVRAALDAAGVRVACVGSPIGKVPLRDPEAPHLDRLRRVCETAHALGTHRIRMFSFYPPEGTPRADLTGEVVDRLGRLLDVADAEGCTLYHENERDIYGETWEECLTLHRALGPRLRAIHDGGNYVLVGSDPLAAMDALLDWVDYLHVKDARTAGKIIVPPGLGDARYPEVLRRYASRPAPRFLALEPHLAVFAGRASLEKKTAATPTVADGFAYPDAESAFAAAAEALRALLPAAARD